MIRIRADVHFWLLTKRAERMEGCLPWDWLDGWEDVEDRERMTELVRITCGALKSKSKKRTIRALLNADQVVIAAGGGGIPVLEQGINLHGASAIIEKDLAAGLLAEELNADTLLILTSVENVSLNHGQVNEQKLGSITVADAKKYIEENQFASGSMLPKIEAGISFIEKGEGRSTVITDMAHAKEGYEGKTGTTIR